ncbi:poly(A) polymerase, partial [filamentous cyanobacterium CCP5]
MHLVLCHTTADFDCLGAAVGIARLRPGSRIVLAGGAHPTVQRFLALHRDEYPLMERRSVNFEHVQSLTVVDAAYRDRFGPISDWIDRAADSNLPISRFDHHLGSAGDIPTQHRYVDAVGAATTLVVEQLQASQIEPTAAEATVMALGIHVDTGSLTYEQATARDAQALAWLMAFGASQRAIADFVEPVLSPQLQDLFSLAMDSLEGETLEGYLLSRVTLAVEEYVPGLSSLAERLMSWSDSDLLLVGAYYPHTHENHKLTLIGRVRGRLADRAQHLDRGE